MAMMAFPDGYWEIDSSLDLNQFLEIPLDGIRTLLATAQDVAGNPMPMNNQIGENVDSLDIFIDTQGPQITDVEITGDLTGYNLFGLKDDGTLAPTPLIESLTIYVEDLPERVASFLYIALEDRGPDGNPAENPGNYLLVGDANGIISISDVIVTNAAPVPGAPAEATIELQFAEPLPDDRFTLTIADEVVDPAGNQLDGESNAVEPNGAPNFPSGDSVPGGDFVARFTVDFTP